MRRRRPPHGRADIAAGPKRHERERAPLAGMPRSWRPSPRSAGGPPSSRTPLAISTGGVTGSTTRSAPPSAASCATIRRPSDRLPHRGLGRLGRQCGPGRGRPERRSPLAQADTLYDAVTGTGGFAASSLDDKVRALFSPVVETFLVLTAARQLGAAVGDLRGRRISIGAPASGTEVTFRRMMAARGWSPADFAALSDIQARCRRRRFVPGRVDAVAFVAANPVPVIQEATFTCDARFVPLDQEFARAMVERYPYYVPAAIPGGLYPNNPVPRRPSACAAW